MIEPLDDFSRQKLMTKDGAIGRPLFIGDTK
jgi:hypothetical protein